MKKYLLFKNTFDSMGTISNKTLIERIKNKNRDLYDKKSYDEWLNIFPEDKYNITRGVEALLKYHSEFIPKEDSGISAKYEGEEYVVLLPNDEEEEGVEENSDNSESDSLS